jgi:hypothetical protein
MQLRQASSTVTTVGQIKQKDGYNGSRIESRGGGGADFSHTSRPAQGPTQSPVQLVPYPGVKRPERGANHPHPSSAEVTNE